MIITPARATSFTSLPRYRRDWRNDKLSNRVCTNLVNFGWSLHYFVTSVKWSIAFKVNFWLDKIVIQISNLFCSHVDRPTLITPDSAPGGLFSAFCSPTIMTKVRTYRYSVSCRTARTSQSGLVSGSSNQNLVFSLSDILSLYREEPKEPPKYVSVSGSAIQKCCIGPSLDYDHRMREVGGHGQLRENGLPLLRRSIVLRPSFPCLFPPFLA